MHCGGGAREAPGRVDGSSRAMLATARPSCFFLSKVKSNIYANADGLHDAASCKIGLIMLHVCIAQ